MKGQLVQMNANKTIMSYPGFFALPSGIKRLLVESETHFFERLNEKPQEPRQNSQREDEVESFAC